MEYNLCRCCLSKDHAKDLYTSYVWLDKNEIYSEMLQECFNIVLSRTENSSICERCVGQLRGALRFKETVLHAERQLAASVQHSSLHDDPLFMKMETKDEGDSNESHDIFLAYADSSSSDGGSTADPLDLPALQPQDSAVSSTLQRTEEEPSQQQRVEEAGVTPECSRASPGEGPSRSRSLERRLAGDTSLVKLPHIRVKDLERETCHVASEPSLGNHNRTAEEESLESSEPTPPAGAEAALVRTQPRPREPHSLKSLEQSFKLRSCSVSLQRILPGDLHTCEPCHVTFDCESGLTRHNRSRHSAEKPATKGVCYETSGTEEIRHMLICDICGKRFYLKTHLISHLATHSDRKGYSCKDCKKQFKYNFNLIVHKCVNSLGTPYSCPFCSEKFKYKSEFNRHVVKHPTQKLYSCDKCGRRFTHRSSMYKHMRIHTGDKPYSCKLCDRMFREKGSLKRHLRLHTDEKPHSCDVCDKRFRLKTDLTSHMYNHTGGKTYSCEFCDKMFRQKGSLNRHLRIHTGEPGLTRHNRSRHSAVKPAKKGVSYETSGTEEIRHMLCDICGKRFDRKSYLISHLATHSDGKGYSCKVCKRKFKYNCNLINHRCVNSSGTPYSCPFCSEKFKYKSEFNCHVVKHPTQKLYSCDKCGRRFTHHSSMYKHMRTHTGEKPYSCELCDRMFRQKGNLNRHLRLHTGEKPYSCDVCDKRFIQKADLSCHLRIHTGEKPYSCHVCDKSFKQRNKLTRHVKIHIGEIRCNLCDKKFKQKSELICHLRIHAGEDKP